MKRVSILILLVSVVALTLVGAGPVTAKGPKSLKVKAKPFEFDPDSTGIARAAWVTHEGLPDAGKSDHALFLQKDGETAVVAAAGASISRVKGITLTELGFDIRSDSHCTGGSPRFNVTATDGFHFLGGCANGTLTPDTPEVGWTRVRIDPANPAQAFPPIAPGATILSITVLFDEGTDVPVTPPQIAGTAIIDNIDVNGVLIGKPGNAR